jgi:cytochrome c6
MRPAQRLRPLAALLLCASLMAVSVPSRAADVSRGDTLYREHCALCHGTNGRPVLPLAPDFTKPTALLRADPQLLALIREGRGTMPAYQGVLRDRDILDIITYVRSLRGRP